MVKICWVIKTDTDKVMHESDKVFDRDYAEDLCESANEHFKRAYHFTKEVTCEEL